MGVCCSTTAKPATTSSSRHYVSVISTPSLFPAESEYKQDSAVVSHTGETFSRFENAVEGASGEDLKEQRSTSGFIETAVHPMKVDLCDEAAKHHQREKKSLENVSQQRDLWTGRVEKWSDEPSTDNEDTDSKVIASKRRCAVKISRLKKKDSTRLPKYKDEIMLSDNIDSIVEREIPEIPDEESTLADDIDYILNDDIPAVESDWSKSPSPRIPPRPPTRRGQNKEDDKLARDIEYILSDGEPDTKSNGTGASSPGAKPPPKTSNATRRNKKQVRDVKVFKRMSKAVRDLSGQALEQYQAKEKIMPWFTKDFLFFVRLVY